MNNRQMKEKFMNLFNVNSTELVTWADLEEVTPLKWIDLSDGKEIKKEWKVRYKNIPTKKHSQLIFLTELKQGHGYDYHSHDCKETITVLKGICTVNGYRTIKEGEKATFFSNTRHRVMADSDSVLFVEFNRV